MSPQRKLKNKLHSQGRQNTMSMRSNQSIDHGKKVIKPIPEHHRANMSQHLKGVILTFNSNLGIFQET